MKKRIGALLLVVVLLMTSLFTGCNSEPENVVKIFNWGDYMDPEVIDLFEQETGIKVIYDTYETNEDMYLKIKNSGSNSYDVCFPSDYMIEKMIREDMLAEINYDNIPNTAGIDNRYLTQADSSYDPGNKHSVPYVWGTVCICYDPAVITEPVTSWDILWDETYSKQIFMMDSERDSIGVALMSLGYSLNSRDPQQLEEAKQKLIEQKPLLITYTTDDVKDKMIGREGALAVLWSCDIGIIMEQDDTLAYAIPESGTNAWYDAAVILKNAHNTENAEKFINFLCRPDIALMNANYLGCMSPVTEAAAQVDEALQAIEAVNPSDEVLAKCEVFKDMTDIADTYTQIWSDVRALG